MPSYLYRCTPSASACGLASLTVPSLWSLSGLLGNTLSQLLKWKISSLPALSNCWSLYHYLLKAIQLLLPPCLCILHQAVKTTGTFSSIGEKRGTGKVISSLGCTHWFLPHTRSLGELAACRSGLSEPERSEASLQPLEAILQMAQPLPNKQAFEGSIWSGSGLVHS